MRSPKQSPLAIRTAAYVVSHGVDHSGKIAAFASLPAHDADRPISSRPNRSTSSDPLHFAPVIHMRAATSSATLRQRHDVATWAALTAAHDPGRSSRRLALEERLPEPDTAVCGVPGLPAGGRSSCGRSMAANTRRPLVVFTGRRDFLLSHPSPAVQAARATGSSSSGVCSGHWFDLLAVAQTGDVRARSWRSNMGPRSVGGPPGRTYVPRTRTPPMAQHAPARESSIDAECGERRELCLPVRRTHAVTSARATGAPQPSASSADRLGERA